MVALARAVLGALLVLLVLGVTPAAGDADAVRMSIIRVDASQVPRRDVYVTVSDSHGLPITGLDRVAFSAAEDGVRMPIESVAAVTDSQAPIAFGLVMDVSGSMNDEGKLDAAKQGASGLVGALGPADSAAVISFGEQVDVVQEFTSNQDSLNAAISGLQAGGNTALYDAIVRTSLLAQALPQSAKALVVVTDGMDTKSSARLNDVLQSLSTGRSLVYPIGIGSDVDRTVLDAIAGAGRGQAFYPDDPTTLGSTFQAILDQLRLTYLLRYQAPTSSGDQSHTAEVTVGYQGQEAQASSMFVAPSNTVAVDFNGLSRGETVTGDRQISAVVRSGRAQRLDLLLDGSILATSAGQPSSISSGLKGLPPGDHDVGLRVTDTLGKLTEQHVAITVPGPPTPQPASTPMPTATPDTVVPPTPTVEALWPWWLLITAALLSFVFAAVMFWRRAPAPMASATPDLPSDDMTLELSAVAPPQQGPATASARLHIESDGQLHDVALGSDPVTIGREADNSLVLHDPHVSRHHARISLQNGDYWIEDLHSQNGTLLNGQVSIDRRRLETGDMLAIGDTKLTYLSQVSSLANATRVPVTA